MQEQNLKPKKIKNETKLDSDLFLKQADLTRKRVQKQQYPQESSEDDKPLLAPRAARPGHLGNNNQEAMKQRKIDEKLLFGDDCKQEEKKTEVKKVEKKVEKKPKRKMSDNKNKHYYLILLEQFGH